MIDPHPRQVKLPDSKLPQVGTTIFTVMSALAEEHGALNLAQGFPDFQPPPLLLERVAHHLQAGHNQYAPMPGLPALRTAIARQISGRYGRPMNADTEVTITSGATEALFSAITAFVHPGDEVIVFDPAYDTYDPAIRLAGGVPVHLPLVAPAFSVDWNRVRDSIGRRTRMIILNTPHNPTGAVLDADDLRSLAEIVRDSSILLLGDEVYEHIIFDGRRHESLLRDPELAARSLVVSSFGKTLHVTGWKIGYCVGPPALTAEFRRIHQFVQFCVAAPMQWAIADFLESDTTHHAGLAAFYEEKRNLFGKALQDSRFRCRPASGTYFQLVDFSAVSDESDVAFARRLTAEHGIAAIPVSVFHADSADTRLLRFCFAKSAATLERAGELLCAI